MSQGRIEGVKVKTNILNVTVQAREKRYDGSRLLHRYCARTSTWSLVTDSAQKWQATTAKLKLLNIKICNKITCNSDLQTTFVLQFTWKLINNSAKLHRIKILNWLRQPRKCFILARRTTITFIKVNMRLPQSIKWCFVVNLLKYENDLLSEIHVPCLLAELHKSKTDICLT